MIDHQTAAASSASAAAAVARYAAITADTGISVHGIAESCRAAIEARAVKIGGAIHVGTLPLVANA